MARIAVTYEQVAAVANALYAQGVKDPGAKAIRDELAKRVGPGGTTGSPNTIQRHLTGWRAQDRPMEATEIPQLPMQLAGDIARALNAAASVAREKVEDRMSQVQAELAELVASGESNEARIEELTQELAARTSQRDSMAGQLAERTSEVNELKTVLTAERANATTMGHELYIGLAAVQAANGRIDEIRQTTERRLSRMQGELDQARTGLADAERRATEGEKRAIAASAHLDGERAAKVTLEAYVAELQITVKRLEGDSSRAAAAEALATGLSNQITLLNETVALLRSMVQATAQETPTAPVGSRVTLMSASAEESSQNLPTERATGYVLSHVTR